MAGAHRARADGALRETVTMLREITDPFLKDRTT